LDTWGLEEAQFPLFLEAVQVQQKLKRPIKVEEREKISASVEQISKDAKYKSLLLEWSANHCKSLQANDHETAQVLAIMATDSRWPEAARQQFLSMIALNWRHWGAAIWSEIKSQPNIVIGLQQALRIYANPTFAALSYQQALRIADPKYAEFIAPLLSSQPLAFDDLHDMLLELGHQSIQQLPALRTVFHQQLRQAVKTEAESAKLVQLARTAPIDADCRLLITDFYRQNVELKTSSLAPSVWADGYLQLAIESPNPHAALQALNWLQQIPGLRISPALALRWRQLMAGTVHELACTPILNAIAAPPPINQAQTDSPLNFSEFAGGFGKSIRPIGRALPQFRTITTLQLFILFCIVLLSCGVYFGMQQKPPYGTVEITPDILTILPPVLYTGSAVFLLAWGITYLRPNHWARVTHPGLHANA
jgi:hypothetical protein